MEYTCIIHVFDINATDYNLTSTIVLHGFMDKLLLQVADEVRSSWQSIGLHLGCTFQQLEDYKASHPDSMKDCLLHILCDWKAKEGRNATVAALVDACINAKVGGAVKKVLGIE